MPFKSKAQQRFMFAAEERGEIPKGTAKRWADHTPNIKKLPEKKGALGLTAEAQYDSEKGASVMKKTANQIADEVLAKVSQDYTRQQLAAMPAAQRQGLIAKKKQQMQPAATPAQAASPAAAVGPHRGKAPMLGVR
jgi:hypothetical protein